MAPSGWSSAERTSVLIGHPALPLAILACLGLIMAVSLTSVHGPGVSTDAVNYLSAAGQLAAGEGFTNFEGDLYVLWPPLYPALLSIPSTIFNLDPLIFGAALNAIAFAGIIWLTGILAARVLDFDRFLSTFAAAATLLSTGTFSVSVNIGSDPLFFVLMLTFLLFFERYSRLTDRPSLAGMIVVCGLACLQRYIGATLVLTGFIGVLYARRAELRRALIQASAFAVLSALPLVAWIVRNHNVSGTFIGVRDPWTWRPDENIQDIALKASRWFVPYQLGSRPLFWVALTVLLLVLFILYNRRRRGIGVVGAPRPITFALILFSVIYLAAMVVLTKSVDHKNIAYDDRLYLPAFFSLLLLALLFLRRTVFPLLDGRKATIGKVALFGACLLWLSFPAFGTYKFWVRCINDGGIAYYNIYNMPAYRDSAVTQHLASWATDSATPVYSNYPAAVYLSTRRIANSLPSRSDFFGAVTPLKEFVGVWPGSSPAVLVWYEPNTKRNLYSPTELAELADLRPVFTSEDGTIYLIQAR